MSYEKAIRNAKRYTHCNCKSVTLHRKLLGEKSKLRDKLTDTHRKSGKGKLLDRGPALASAGPHSVPSPRGGLWWAHPPQIKLKEPQN